MRKQSSVPSSGICQAEFLTNSFVNRCDQIWPFQNVNHAFANLCLYKIEFVIVFAITHLYKSVFVIVLQLLQFRNSVTTLSELCALRPDGLCQLKAGLRMT